MSFSWIKLISAEINLRIDYKGKQQTNLLCVPLKLFVCIALGINCSRNNFKYFRNKIVVEVKELCFKESFYFLFLKSIITSSINKRIHKQAYWIHHNARFLFIYCDNFPGLKHNFYFRKRKSSGIRIQGKPLATYSLCIFFWEINEALKQRMTFMWRSSWTCLVTFQFPFILKSKD